MRPNAITKKSCTCTGDTGDANWSLKLSVTFEGSDVVAEVFTGKMFLCYMIQRSLNSRFKLRLHPSQANG